ncbi:unnamed protein product, partial [Urochloa humidicola]
WPVWLGSRILRVVDSSSQQDTTLTPSPSSRRRRRRRHRDSRYRRRRTPRPGASRHRGGLAPVFAAYPHRRRLHHRRICAAASDLDDRRISAVVPAVSDRINCRIDTTIPEGKLIVSKPHFTVSSRLAWVEDELMETTKDNQLTICAAE